MQELKFSVLCSLFLVWGIVGRRNGVMLILR
jgi:hypothetical protein